MGQIHLLRHGQASLAAEDYDQLSPLGQLQCQRLGAYWQARGRRFDAVLMGTLRRHAQSLAALGETLPGLPAPEICPALDEYNTAALLAAWPVAEPGSDARPGGPPQTPEAVRAFFRHLRAALLAWMEGRSQPQGMASYAEFEAGMAALLARLQAEQGPQAQVLIVSSGGPISTALGWVLGLAPALRIELNLQLRNSALSPLLLSPQRLVLQGFNALPHLDAPGDEALHSHA